MTTPDWIFQDGTNVTDVFSDAVDGFNDTFVIVGHTSGDWNGKSTGSTDMIATKLDIDGNVLWRWQNGSSEHERATAVAVAEDGSIVVGGFRSPGTYVAVKLDAEGNFVWQWEDGTGEGDELNGLAMWEDGSMIFAGYTEGDWNGTRLGGGDFTAWKLNSDGSMEWRWQGGTQEKDKFNCVAVGKDGSAVLAGFSRGAWDGFISGSQDFAAVKIDSDGSELWKWQDGTTSDDVIYDVAIGIDGSVFLAGDTGGGWSVANAGLTDFVVVKLDAEGNELWRRQGGTSGYDRWRGILANADGSVTLAGLSWGLWGDSNAGAGDIAASKLDENGTDIWNWQGGSPGWELANAIASSGSSSHVLLAGVTSGALGRTNQGVYDFAALLLDTSKLGIAASTSSPLQTPPPGLDVSPSFAPTASGGAAKSSEETSEVLPAPTPNTDTPVSRSSSTPTLVVDPATLSPSSSRPTSSPTLAADPTIVNPISARPTYIPTLAANNGTPSNTTPLVVALSGVIILIAMVGAGWLYRRQPRNQEGNAALATIQHGENDKDDTESTFPNATPSLRGGLPPGRSDLLGHEDGLPSLHMQKKGTSTGALLASFGTVPHVQDVGEQKAVDASLQLNDAQRQVVGEVGHGEKYKLSRSSASATTTGGLAHSPIDDEESIYPSPTSRGEITLPSGTAQIPVGGVSVAQAVMAAAQELVRMSQIPGVAEAAELVIILMNLVTDSSDMSRTTDHVVKRCRSVMVLLQRAASVLEEIDDTNDEAHRTLIEEVRDAVGDLVELIKVYQSKGKISQVLMSTLFKRRQEEAGAVIDAAINRLHFGLQIQVGHKLNKLGQDLRGGMHLQLQGSEPESKTPPSATVLLVARRMRRQRNLDKVEIPEDDLTVTDELLGKGGFGAVYIADYNGRNAAAKVVQVEHDLGKLDDGKEEMVCGIAEMEAKKDQDKSRRKAFWRELQAMIRLRSPHTVHVYGAITSRQDRLVLVMELLPGGDLRALLKHAVEPLTEEHARRIIGDICTGMSFLHHKETIHGDLKSPNVLFDGAGRAKIGDFGTSKWPTLTNSTGLATYTTHANHSTKMSYAWAAPEVLDAKSASYASDVYSFGVVAWEVLSRKLPWEDECLRNIFVRVVIKEQRPEIPSGTPADLAKVIHACWGGVPGNRPTFKDILKSIGWG